jgi:ornithine cyclodeaminase
MLVLTRSDIQRAISMREAIEAVRLAFSELSAGKADVPLRLALAQAEHDGVTLVMPGRLTDPDSLAVKIVSVHNRNPERSLPRINALVTLIDTATGRPAAIIEGGYLTALRTGAASGLATDLLAREDAGVAAIFGAGVQARTQILAVAAVRPVSRFVIHTPHRRNIQPMIEELRPLLDPAVEWDVAESPSQAVRDAQIVCAATTSLSPVFDGRDLPPGALVNGVGSFTPRMQEIDCETLKRASKIVVDSREAALTEAGDLIVALDQGAIGASDIYGEIGEIASGLKPGRESAEEITYFKSVGNAVQDVAVAQAVYLRALQDDLGIEIDLDG